MICYKEIDIAGMGDSALWSQMKNKKHRKIKKTIKAVQKRMKDTA